MNKNSYKEKELYEKFTIEGFFAVSMWSFLYWMYSFWILEVFESMDWWGVKFNIKSAAILYLILWFVVFLFGCLIPKLLGQK